MIRKTGNSYILSTPHSAYVFRVMDTGHLEHLYYGPSLGDPELLTDETLEKTVSILEERREFPSGNMIAYDKEHPALTLEDLRLEMSSYGKGDIREPFVEVIHADGSFTSDFLFEKAELRSEKTVLRTLPSSYFEEPVCSGNMDGKANSVDSGIAADAEGISGGQPTAGEKNKGTGIGEDRGRPDPVAKDKDERFQELVVTLQDAQYGLRLELYYGVFEDCDCITRGAKLVNDSAEPVRVKRLMSTQLDFADDGYVMSLFHGAWAREMERTEVPVKAGKIVNASYTGTSSSRANPFVMLHREETTERTGLCYGLNLIYSGNHYEACEVNAFGKTRFVSGINLASFSWLLEPGEELEAPEAVMTVTGRGFSRMSLQMHQFIREHIVRGYWKNRPRPVLLNSWEATYFKYDEAKLLKLAKAAKAVGIELFVLDDGWFGERSDDTRSLGDWQPDPGKLPGGLKQLSEKITALGMDFGIWVEPEMVNVDSRLYREHPEWTFAIPGKPHAEGRNQRMLDFANPEVVDYMTAQMREVFASGRISYVKWDMNRIMSDVFSPYLPAERKEESAHRYMLGVYRMMKDLTEAFPEILFEGCAAGGNRFDPGILCYFPQIWASDNTDALQRVRIQEGYSFGYPLSVAGAHVSSSPNHQTLRQTSLETRFHVAVFGLLGYELNLADLGRAETEKIRRQIILYKIWRDTLQGGNFYRGRSGNIHEWTCVSQDKTRAVSLVFQEQAEANHMYEQLRPRGLDNGMLYSVYNTKEDLDIRQFGDLVNTIAPVHIRQGSQLHHILAKFVTLPGEQESFLAPGSVLTRVGVTLAPAYAGTGLNENTRCFPDFSSRLYFMEAVSDSKDTWEAASESEDASDKDLGDAFTEDIG